MKRLVLALCLAAVAMTSVACTSAPKTPSVEKVTAPTGGVRYTVMPMGANERAALAKMPEAVAEYKAGKVKDGKAEGVDWLDVTGVTPEFIGYSVNAFSPVAGTADIQIVEMDYVDGHITQASYPSAELEADDTEVRTMYQSNGIPAPATMSDGEKAALKAAKDWMKKQRPDADWATWGIKHYLFLYRKGGVGVVIGTTLTGSLDRNSSIIELAP